MDSRNIFGGNTPFQMGLPLGPTSPAAGITPWNPPRQPAVSREDDAARRRELIGFRRTGWGTLEPDTQELQYSPALFGRSKQASLSGGPMHNRGFMGQGGRGAFLEPGGGGSFLQPPAGLTAYTHPYGQYGSGFPGGAYLQQPMMQAVPVVAGTVLYTTRVNTPQTRGNPYWPFRG